MVTLRSYHASKSLGGCLLFESLFTLKTFVPTRMGDFIGDVYVCLPLVGGKIPLISDLKKGTCLSLKLYTIVDCCYP